MIRFARYMLVSALMLSIGAQWAVLQSAAWMSMAVTYSFKTGSVTEGMKETFDGEHPCPMCVALKKSKDTEKKDPKQEASKKKLDLFAGESVGLVIALPLGIKLSRTADESATVRATAPPHQPPRAA